MIGDPDPYTATMNALQHFRVDDVVISTFPATRSGWLRSDLIERVRGATRARRARRRRPRARRGRPTEPAMEAAIASPTRPPRPAARGQPQLAGRAPAARDAAFHHLRDDGLRGVLHRLLLHPDRQPDPWPGAGTDAPGRVAGINTAILLSSSLTMHWALTSIKNGNRFGLKAGMLSDVPARPDVPVHPDQRVRPHRLRAARQRPGSDLLLADRACTAPTCSSACACWLIVTIRAFRGHYSPENHRGVEVPGIYWHFVDIMWIFVYSRSTSCRGRDRAEPAAVRG